MFVHLENRKVEKDKEHLYMKGKKPEKMYNNIFYRKYVDFLSTLENEDFFEFLAFQLKQTDDIVELRQFLKK